MNKGCVRWLIIGVYVILLRFTHKIS